MIHEKLIAELERDEGNKPRVYTDSKGIPTIGIGRNLLKGLSRDEIYYLANNDIAEAEGELDHALPWWRELDEVRQRALANLCFNMGIARLSGFHKMLRASQWKNDVGPERAGRIHRMLLTGGVE